MFFSIMAGLVSLGATIGGAVATVAGASVATGTAIGTLSGAGVGLVAGAVAVGSQK